MTVRSDSERQNLSWTRVLTAKNAKPFKFDVVDAASDGSVVRIRNTDGTATLVCGSGLTIRTDTSGPQPRASTLTGGTIREIRHVTPEGEVLRGLTGLALPAGGPSRMVSFTWPEGALSSLDWAGQHAEPMPEPDRPASAPPAATALAAIVPAPTAPGPPEPAPPRAPPTMSAPGVQDALQHYLAQGERTAAPAQRAVLKNLAVACGIVASAGAIAFLFVWFLTPKSSAEFNTIKLQFARPQSVPYPAGNVPTTPKIELGRMLFSEKRLSSNDAISCATCHNPTAAFSDGKIASTGFAGRPLRLHTPTLWNVAWGRAFFWDGRIASLEEQAAFPMANPLEMNQTIEVGAQKLKSDPAYQAAFASAFPRTPEITPTALTQALASYQRTLVSPTTRFDRWVAGDPFALTSAEQNGFRLFLGKAGCVNCHSGWAFTDYAFHDIGLPAGEKGRGGVLGLAHLEHAFKTPSLRELQWTAPYMHDGSMTTLDQVITHYATGGVDRTSRSPDMPRKIDLTREERADLIAFLKTLSSDRATRPAVSLELATSQTQAQRSAAMNTTVIGQKDKIFAPGRVRITAGQSLVIWNNDTRPHNSRVEHPDMTFISEMQEPGDKLTLPFPKPGQFEVMCGVHPNMRLDVEVLPAPAR